MRHKKQKNRKKPPMSKTVVEEQPAIETLKGVAEANKEAFMGEASNLREDALIPQMKQSSFNSEPLKMENKKRRDIGWLYSGLAGACLAILALCLIAFIKPEFRHANYYICDDPSMLEALLTTSLTPSDSVFITQTAQEETAKRKDAIEDLINQKMIVSSEEFASNISGYYNTLIAVLSAIFIILNLGGYFSWRNNANLSLEQKQRELDDVLNNIDDRMEKSLEETLRKNLVVKEKLESYVQELLDQRETLDDDEWDKLHLLLRKYKKAEVLKAIKEDGSEENDGVIE